MILPRKSEEKCIYEASFAFGVKGLSLDILGNIYKVNQCSRNYATVLGAISAVCRKQAAVSHIVLTKISKKFVLFGMLPYLCIVNQTKQVLGDAKQEN